MLDEMLKWWERCFNRFCGSSTVKDEEDGEENMECYPIGCVVNFRMVKLVAQSLLLGLYLQVLAVFAVDVHRLNIWPMPQSVSNGHQILHMSKDFELMTQGTKYPDASGILKDGFSRLLDVVQAAHVVDGNFSHFDQSVLLQGIHVVIFSLNDELQYGIDESYKLSIPAAGNPVYAHLEAQTVYGALHGLQTFSQLCHFNFTTRVIEVHQVPWNIIDQPRYGIMDERVIYMKIGLSWVMGRYVPQYKELSKKAMKLLRPKEDTSRHYQPLPMIKKVIDSMAYTKLENFEASLLMLTKLAFNLAMLFVCMGDFISAIVDVEHWRHKILYFKESCPASFDILPVERVSVMDAQLDLETQLVWPNDLPFSIEWNEPWILILQGSLDVCSSRHTRLLCSLQSAQVERHLQRSYSQSFPLEIPSYPKLWFGAYSISERYAMADAAEIVRQVISAFYAQRRGINVLAEIDVPGHALSW
ncbi:hypothetical protein TEA_021685 [Camellia sinensis var. sinensis]|uniref:beta-N-acetylhexosaminidase n=1 Tax=Camellia sinensis var. sinensis TaxID=542762 RepID=A0A4S4EIR6_CAMSN|nr:hypothetical protein TEA_021685 [Camellia sinensis var. sinensis]